MKRRHHLNAAATLGLVALVFWATSAAAQVVERQLSEPDATYNDGFALVRGVRELSDGRVMVADPLAQVLLIIDLESGTADTLGGVGQGPGEYRQPDGLFGLPGDSTLLVDLGNARLTMLGPDGGFGETMPMTQGEPGPGGGLLIIVPQGVDALGNVYFQPFGGGMGRAFPDSGAVVRLRPADMAIDTLAKVKLPELKRAESGGANSRQVSIRPVPLSAEDAWAVARDGRVAVARARDYHLEWIQPDGTLTRGSPVGYEPVKIERADKEEWVERLGNGLRIGVAIENGNRRVVLGRGGGGASPELDEFDWPKTKPAFAADGVWVTPEGDAWVERQVGAGAPRVFDVFGGDGELTGRIALPADRVLVGFGRGTAYAVRSDELGLQWLERYRRSAG